MQIWSSEDGGGHLVMRYDFEAKPVQTYYSFCTTGNVVCLYITMDPGFQAPQAAEEEPAAGLFALDDGAKVSIRMASLDGGAAPADEGLVVQINGQRMTTVGAQATIGTMPNVHNHPAWQITVPADEFGDYRVAFQLISDSPAYADSPVYTAIVTNVPPPPQSPTPTRTPRATPTPASCSGDCDANGRVVISELVTCVNVTLDRLEMDICPACDGDEDGRVAVNDLVAAVRSAIVECIAAVPTVTLAHIQAEIFTPTCATQFCHDSASANAGLVLDAENAYTQLVGVPPTTFSANAQGLLRVTAGDPSRSFLLVKLEGPPPDQGSRMPLSLPQLTPDQIDLVRHWIEQGAPAE
jgi:hypothetical protein